MPQVRRPKYPEESTIYRLYHLYFSYLKECDLYEFKSYLRFIVENFISPIGERHIPGNTNPIYELDEYSFFVIGRDKDKNIYLISKTGNNGNVESYYYCNDDELSDKLRDLLDESDNMDEHFAKIKACMPLSFNSELLDGFTIPTYDETDTWEVKIFAQAQINDIEPDENIFSGENQTLKINEQTQISEDGRKIAHLIIDGIDNFFNKTLSGILGLGSAFDYSSLRTKRDKQKLLLDSRYYNKAYKTLYTYIKESLEISKQQGAKACAYFHPNKDPNKSGIVQYLIPLYISSANSPECYAVLDMDARKKTIMTLLNQAEARRDARIFDPEFRNCPWLKDL